MNHDGEWAPASIVTSNTTTMRFNIPARLVLGWGDLGKGWMEAFDLLPDGGSFHAAWLGSHWPAYTGSGQAPTHPACADLDGDGIDEIVVGLGDLGQGWIQVAQHKGEGRFQPFLDNGGWTRVQWIAYATSGKAPTWPTILNQRNAPLSLGDHARPAGLLGGTDRCRPCRAAEVDPARAVHLKGEAP